jgi:protein-S-isoprenylcysteine O-methyltransferase Ste14
MKRILPPTHFLTYLLISVLLHLILPIKQVIFFPYNLLGIILIIAGIILNLWADRIFKDQKTTVKPDEKPTSLIDYGPYKISRNPMYLGMAVILIGAGIILGSISSFSGSVLFILAMEFYFIPDEERLMKEAFGLNFEEYKEKVRRWI